VLDQAVDRTYPANTRCLTTHDDMMKDWIEQYLVKHGLIRTYSIKHFRSNIVPNELTNEAVSSHIRGVIEGPDVH
jgi:hypothetical protein